eukprot:scaffold78935_cov17-Tisochrysis_lutea.AAC.1
MPTNDASRTGTRGGAGGRWKPGIGELDRDARREEGLDPASDGVEASDGREDKEAAGLTWAHCQRRSVVSSPPVANTWGWERCRWEVSGPVILNVEAFDTASFHRSCHTLIQGWYPSMLLQLYSPPHQKPPHALTSSSKADIRIHLPIKGCHMPSTIH